jgi:hypothetical protein
MTKVIDIKALSDTQLQLLIAELITLTAIQEQKIDALAKRQAKFQRLAELLVEQFNALEVKVNTQ